MIPMRLVAPQISTSDSGVHAGMMLRVLSPATNESLASPHYDPITI